MSIKTNKYHIAIDGQGYLLKSTPNSPARRMDRTEVFGNRFASGDRDYTDFSLWWFWAQTDWTGGVKESIEWKDDAQYYYSKNINAYSKEGSITIISGLSLEKEFAKTINCGTYGYYLGTSYNFFGSMSGTPRAVYKGASGTYTDITGDAINNNIDSVQQIMSHKNNLWIFNQDNADTTDVVLHTSDAAPVDNTDYTDHTTAIKTAMTYSNLHAATCALEIDDLLYVALYNGTATPWQVGIVSTVDNGANWVKVLDVNGYHKIVSMVSVGEDIYYLLAKSIGTLELRFYDLSADTDTKVDTIYNHGIPLTEFAGNAFMHLLNNKLVICNPLSEIWEYDLSTGTLTRIFKRRSDLTNSEIEFRKGGVLYDNKIWYGNLMYDGEYFYHTKMNQNSTADATPAIPIFTNNSLIYWNSLGAKELVYKDDVFKAGNDANYLQFSEINEVSTIEKVANELTIIFDKFDIAEEIEIQYSIDGGTTWTVLGSASATIDGTSVTQKSFYFGDAVKFRKMIIRAYLNGDGSSTPTLKDISIKYIPITDYRFKWKLTIKANNEMFLLDEKSKEQKNADYLREKLRASFYKKQMVEFEDVDYAETLLNEASLTAGATTITVDSTDGFPESGRIKIDNEEILYTGKTAATFTGCTRGARGTTAITHANNSEVNNLYKVLVIDYNEQNPTLDDNTATDYMITVELLEA